MFLSKRNGIYYLWYRDDLGRKKKVSTGATTKSAALEFLRDFDKSNRPKQTSHLLLSAFAPQLFEHIQANMTPGTLWLYQNAFRHLIQFAGDIRLQQLSAFHFDRYKIHRLKEVGPVTVNIELRVLKAGLTVARRWKMVPANPFEGLSMVPVPEREPVFYSKEDFYLLVGSMKEPWLRNVVVFAALSGMRQGEILSLKWSQVDLANGMVHIESRRDFRTKGGKRRTIPLNSGAESLLRSLEHRDSGGLVFTHHGAPLKSRWVGAKLRRYVRGLGLDRKLNFHSLRHSFASWLAMDGVSIYQISRLLGHSDVSVTQDFYAHLQPDSLRDAVNRIQLNVNR